MRKTLWVFAVLGLIVPSVPAVADDTENEKVGIQFLAAWVDGNWAGDNVVFVADGDWQEAGAYLSFDDGCVSKSINGDGDFASASVELPLTGRDKLMNASGTVDGLWVEISYSSCDPVSSWTWNGRVDLEFSSEGYGKLHHGKPVFEDRAHTPGVGLSFRLTRSVMRNADTWVSIDFRDMPDDKQVEFDWYEGPMQSVIADETQIRHTNTK